jgi:predicted nucleic acid-binding Zn ribbon protein
VPLAERGDTLTAFLALARRECQTQHRQPPTYVYKFIDTGETIEVQQAFTDDALTEAVHPATGATMAVKKVFTPVGVTFKGGGFYKTDSRGGKSSTSTSSSASTSTESGSTATPAASSGSDSGSTAAPAAAAPASPSSSAS